MNRYVRSKEWFVDDVVSQRDVDRSVASDVAIAAASWQTSPASKQEYSEGQ